MAKNSICLKDTELHAPKMITIMSLTINIIWGEGRGEPIQPFNEYGNLHFDNE
jgi:hypothetical protein